MALIFESSAEHNDTRILVMGYLPLSVAHPTEITSLVSIAKRTIREKKVSGNVSAGLAEQYEHQLEALKDENVPDLQFIAHSQGIDSTSEYSGTMPMCMETEAVKCQPPRLRHSAWQ
jgi:hypothetical protein